MYCERSGLGVSRPDEAPLQLAAVQLSHCMWGLYAWGPRGSDPTAGEVTAADPVPAGHHAPALRCAVPGRRATRCTSELAPPAVRVRAMLRGWSVAESCAGRRVPASQPVVGRRAHDVGGEIPAACGAAEQAAGPRRSLEETNLDFRVQTAIGPGPGF